MLKGMFTAVALSAACLAGAASAATVSLTHYAGGSADLAAARAAKSAFDQPHVVGSEDFEGFATRTFTEFTSGPFTFTSSTTGTCGSSCTGAGQTAWVRDASGQPGPYGRFNTTLGGSKWLDSNDRTWINIAIDTGQTLFTRFSLLLTDIDDVGSDRFSVKVDGVETTYYTSNYGNADLFLLTFDFGTAVSAANIKLKIDGGDGFGIDDLTISAVPVPATLPLLAAGLGLMGWVGRRRKTA